MTRKAYKNPDPVIATGFCGMDQHGIMD